VRRRRPFALLAPAIMFALVLIGYNVWANAAAAQYDLVARKMIYQFYSSQGWSDPRQGDPGINIEFDGYVYATQLYGAPAETAESLAMAIARHPATLVRRIEKNVTKLLELLTSAQFFPFDLLLLLLALPIAFVLLGHLHRLLLTFGVMVFSVVGMFLIFHIDVRYITICVPAAVMLGSLCVLGLNRLPMPSQFGPNAISIVVLVILLLRLPGHFSALSHAFADKRLDLSPIRSLAEGFLNVTHPSREERGQMVVHMDAAFPPNWSSSDILFLFSYFSRTSLNLPSDSNDLYPRDRIFSFPQCRPATHALVPDTVTSNQDGVKLGAFSANQLGRFAVYRLSNAGKPCGSAEVK